MTRASRLSRSMTVTQFDNGYWYATDLKRFAKELGVVPVSALRKDELERLVRTFLRTGAILQPGRARVSPSTARDVERGLRLDLRVIRYTNDPETKQFLEREARSLAPGFRRRSGARYRLNRWREAQLREGKRLTYRGLVKEYVRLCQSTTAFRRFPHGRYVNFLSDFLAAQPRGTHSQAIKAWRMLKTMDIPKTYAAWKRARGTR